MKTKNLLTAIALPALFAACTAEEIVTENNAVLNEDLSSRIAVENVTLGLGDADSRAAKGEGYNQIVYTAGDKVGALLVDNLTGTSTSDYIQNYTLLGNSFNTNYIFETEDGVNFASEAYMVEGNYVFYFPYNEQRTRASVWAKLPKTQKLTVQADGTYSSFADVLAKSEAAGAPMLVGYDFINRADADKTIAAAMKQIYATPEIKIVNSYTIDHDNNSTTAEVAAPVTIQEIVIKKNSGSFVLNAPLKFSANSGSAWNEAANGASKSIVNVLFNESIPSAKATTHSKGEWVPAQIDPAVARYTSDVVDGTQATGAADTSTEIILTLDEPITIAAAGSLTIYPVLPAEAYTGTSVLQVKVINGAGLSNPYESFGNASLYQGRRYPAEEYTGSVVNDDVKGTTLTAYIGSYTQLEGVRVSTVDELISAIKSAPAATGSAPTYKIRLAGDAVFNTRVASLVNSASSYTKATTIEFVNEVPMEGSFTLAPTKAIKFSEGAKLNASANVTLKSTNVGIASGKNLTVAATASLTYELASMTGATIVNNGSLTVKNTVDATIKNYGVMNITGAGVTLNGIVYNGKSNGTSAGTINVAAPTAVGNEATVADLKNYANSTINNLGTINAAALLNNGKIVNGSETNASATIIAATAGVNQTATDLPAAAIENYAVVDISTNNATIYMENVNAAATVGNGTGTIVNDILATVDNVSGTNYVTYTITGTINAKNINTANLEDNSINKVIMKNVNLSVRDAGVSLEGVNFEFQGNNIISTTLGANGDASLTFGLDGGAQASLYVANGTLTINSGVEFNGKYTLTRNATYGAIVNHAGVATSK